MTKQRRAKDLHPDEVRMTLGEHLEELRSRLIKAIFALFIGAVICYIFRVPIFAFLCWPVGATLRGIGQEANLTYLNPAEAFMTFLKVSIVVGLILSAPYSVTQIWGFIAAGLYPHERKWVRRFVPVSIALFFTGSAFLLTVVSPLLLRFLLTYQTELPDIQGYFPDWLVPDPINKVVTKDLLETWPAAPTTPPGENAPAVPLTQPAWLPVFEDDPADPPEGHLWVNATEREIRIRVGEQVYKVSHLKKADMGNVIQPQIRIGEYVMFILHLAAAFGIGFQVPVVVAFIATIGLASAHQMAGLRKYVWFGMAIGSAFLTPPDIGSMLFLLVPMAMLYEVGLVAARFLERERREA